MKNKYWTIILIAIILISGGIVFYGKERGSPKEPKIVVSGASFALGDTMEISWSGVPSQEILLSIKSMNGEGETLILSAVRGNKYAWAIPYNYFTFGQNRVVALYGENEILSDVVTILPSKNPYLTAVLSEKNLFTPGKIIKVGGSNLSPNSLVILTPNTKDIGKKIEIATSTFAVVSTRNHGGIQVTYQELSFRLPEEIQNGNFCIKGWPEYDVQIRDGATDKLTNKVSVILSPLTKYAVATPTTGSKVEIRSSGLSSITSIANNLLTVNDVDCRTWRVDFENANISIMGSSSGDEARPYNEFVDDWLSKRESGPNRFIISGVVDNNGVVQASEVIKIVQ